MNKDHLYVEPTDEDYAMMQRDEYHLIPLDKTHFHIPSSPWNLVRDGRKMPDIGQEILYVYDMRGTQKESSYRLLNYEVKDQEVRHGFVRSRGYNEATEDYWIDCCPLKTMQHLFDCEADYITYWRPMPEPPPDTFVRSRLFFSYIGKVIMARYEKLGTKVHDGEF